SHNPADYNGIKIVRQRHCLTPEQIQQIREHAMTLPAAPCAARGTLITRSIVDTYIQHISSDIKLQCQLKVVVDCGNAIPGTVAPRLLSALGCDVIPLYCEVDGHFPNHHPDPTIASNLCDLIATVKTHHADLGVGLDGDGD